VAFGKKRMMHQAAFCCACWRLSSVWLELHRRLQLVGIILMGGWLLDATVCQGLGGLFEPRVEWPVKALTNVELLLIDMDSAFGMSPFCLVMERQPLKGLYDAGQLRRASQCGSASTNRQHLLNAHCISSSRLRFFIQRPSLFVCWLYTCV
jgi:hypothetical protein